MSIETRTIPCRASGCRRPVLQHNDQWHLHLEQDGTFRFLVGHDFAPADPVPSDTDPDEDLENDYE